MNLLDVRDFHKRFVMHQIEREIEVLTAISFAVSKGDFVLVRGPNGAGKSTLLRCLYRTYLPTGGSALYCSTAGPIDLARAADVDVAFLRRTEIGHVTQFLRPRPRVSALNLVAEPLIHRGTPRAEAEASARQLLAHFGLKREIWTAYPTTFSGGEQQKVNLARALIVPRRLLLLDEPTASLDATTRGILIDRLRDLKAQGVTMIGVFHHPEDVVDLVDREIVLDPPRDTNLLESRRDDVVR